jgi:hypothetical protein
MAGYGEERCGLTNSSLITFSPDASIYKYPNPISLKNAPHKGGLFPF